MMAAAKKARHFGPTHILERDAIERVPGFKLAVREWQVVRGNRVLSRHHSPEAADAAQAFIADRPLELRVTEDERCAGKRARFHVYYRFGADARLSCDPSWAKTPREAGERIVAAVAEVHGKPCAASVRIVCVIACAPAPLTDTPCA